MSAYFLTYNDVTTPFDGTEYIHISQRGKNFKIAAGDLVPAPVAETDPIFTASGAYGITTGDRTNWNAAYGWGNHASAGYLTSLPAHNHDAAAITTGILTQARGGTGFGAYAAGSLLYASATDVLSKLAIGTNGQVLTLVSGLPAWAAAGGGGSVDVTADYVWTGLHTFNRTASTLGTFGGSTARGQYHTPALTAAAHSDVLVGLDLNASFSNGAFSNVSNIALRVGSPTEASTTRPSIIHMGGTYSSAAGLYPKLILQQSGTGLFGIGVNSSGLEYISTNLHNFYSGTSRTPTLELGYDGTVSYLDVTTGYSPTEGLTPKIRLYGSSYGFGVSGGQLDYISASRHAFFAGSTKLATLFNTGNFCLGTGTDISSSILTMTSTTKGFLPPRMSTTNINAIGSPPEGLNVFDNVLHEPKYYDGSAWKSFGGSGGGGGTIGGSIAITQVAVGSGVNAISGSSALIYSSGFLNSNGAKLGALSGYPGIWFNSGTSDFSNYSFLYDNSLGATILNGPTKIAMRIANDGANSVTYGTSKNLVVGQNESSPVTELGKLHVVGDGYFNGVTRTKSYTVASLPAAGTAGRRAYVTDASSPVFLGIVSGSGSTVCPVFDNGTNWICV